MYVGIAFVPPNRNSYSLFYRRRHFGPARLRLCGGLNLLSRAVLDARLFPLCNM